MVLKEGLVRRDLLEGLCLPEIEKQELKKKDNKPKLQLTKSQNLKTSGCSKNYT